MNSFMNVTIRVASAQARARIRELEAELAILQKQMMATGAASNKMNFLGNTIRQANRLQWVGRQIQTNFTLPLVVAGAFATKFALDNEKAMTRVTKVYGDNSAVFNKLAESEIPALGKAFEALSNEFGVNRKEVINVAGDWAAAGATGLALAKATKLTLQTMVLGEMEAVDATKALIAIQAQYGQSTDELSKTIDTLNMVENQTGISMQGLILGFQRAAGNARSAGVDVEHLAAMLAALTPAAGSPEQAGNSIKTMLSRILSPTKDAANVLKLMNIQITDMAWKSLNGAQRLELLAKRYADLGKGVTSSTKAVDKNGKSTGKFLSAQQAVVSAVLASRYQVNRFDVLMRDVISTHGYYKKALDSSADAQQNFNQKQKELGIVLASNPQRLKQIWTVLQNAMADIVTPLLPMLVYMARAVANLFHWFSNLPGPVQHTVLMMALMLALVGPLVRYMFAWVVLIDLLAGGFAMLGSVMGTAAALIFNPWTLGIAAIITILIIFRDQVKDVFTNVWEYLNTSTSGIARIFQAMRNAIVGAFNSLPSGITAALIAVVRIVQAAAMQVYEWFSYLNPWAHHSPSLVESVTSGMDEIARQMARASGLGALFAQAAADLAKFKAIASHLGKGPFSEERTDVAKSYKSLLPLFDRLVISWKRLTAVAEMQQAAIDKQQAVVDKWKTKLDAANDALDRQEKKLRSLQDALDKLNDEYQSHQDALDAFASAPLVGMKAMEDQIFANDQAQKALRLEMLRWEDVNGSIDDVRENYQALQGDIEQLRGEQASLRAAGAGSDITGPMQAQIDAMQAQADAMAQSVNSGPMAEWQKQLDALQHQAEELDLEKSLQFDPLTKQIQDLVNATQELTFQEIIDGINKEQAAMAALQPQIDAYTDKIATQQALVDKLTKSRDALQAVYDRESKTLDVLQDKYAKTADAIRDIEDALRSMASAAQAASKSAGSSAGGMSPGAANFAGAAGGGFPDVGGDSPIGREGGLEDQSALIKQFTEDNIAELSKTFGSFSILPGFKKKWQEFKAWLEANVAPTLVPIRDAIGNLFDGVSLPDIGGTEFGKDMASIGKWIEQVWGDVTKFVSQSAKLFGPDIKRIIDAFKTFGQSLKREVGPQLEKLRPVLAKFGAALTNLWKYVLQPVALVIGVTLVLALKLAASILSNVLGPAFEVFSMILGDVVRIVVGVLEVVIGLLSGDWKMAWQGAVDIVVGAVKGILDIIVYVLSTIGATIKGILVGVYEIFKWLYDVLIGHSIVPDIVNGIFFWFELLITIPRWIFNNVLKPIYDGFIRVWNNLIKPFLSTWWAMITGAWAGLKTLGKWVYDNILKPIYDKFVSVFKSVKDTVGNAKDSIVSAFSTMKTKAGDFVDAIRAIPGKISDMAGRFKSAGGEIIGSLWKGMKAAGGVIDDLGGDIMRSVRSMLNSGIDKVNNAIPDKIGKGPFTVNLPNDPFPHFYKGGIIKGSRLGTAIIAGDRGHDEAIVPLSGPNRPKFDSMLPGSSGSSSGETHLHFYGDLSFPNITDGEHAETFITNLELLVKD